MIGRVTVCKRCKEQIWPLGGAKNTTDVDGDEPMSDALLPGAGDSELAAAERATRARLGMRAQLAKDALAQVVEVFAEWRETVLDLREPELGVAGMGGALFDDPVVQEMSKLGPVPWVDPAIEGCRNLSWRLEHFSTGGDQEK